MIFVFYIKRDCVRRQFNYFLAEMGFARYSMCFAAIIACEERCEHRTVFNGLERCSYLRMPGALFAVFYSIRTTNMELLLNKRRRILGDIACCLLQIVFGRVCDNDNDARRQRWGSGAQLYVSACGL